MKKKSKPHVAAGAARWAGLTKKESSKQHRLIAQAERTERRCFCGERSMLNAVGRYFDCCRKAGVIVLDLKRKRELKHERESKSNGAGTDRAPGTR